MVVGKLEDQMSEESKPAAMTPEPKPLTWTCRFHPTNGWHEIGCPHVEWTKEQLQGSIESTKRSQPELYEIWRQDTLKLIGNLSRQLDEKDAALDACRAELARATEIYTDEDGDIWTVPPAEAYQKVCLALANCRIELADSKSIQWAEKKILIAEIETSTALRSQLAKAVAQLAVQDKNHQAAAWGYVRANSELQSELAEAKAEAERLRAVLIRIRDYKHFGMDGDYVVATLQGCAKDALEPAPVEQAAPAEEKSNG
jgi:hypothetical protein